MSGKKLSIITVVFNGREVLERTVHSLQRQVFQDFEYILIDGGSTDGTLQIMKRYDSFIASWISEPDRGLYDAMNKGLARATGEYVWFLNAGDEIYATDTLEKLFVACPGDADVIYGETMIVDKEGKEIGPRRLRAPEVLTWKSLRDGMVVCHQSVLVKRSLTGPFDLRYKVAADYEWLLRILKKAGVIYNSRMYLCRFLEGGINKRQIVRALRERYRVMVQYYGFIPTLFRHFLIGFRFFIYVIRFRRF